MLCQGLKYAEYAVIAFWTSLRSRLLIISIIFRYVMIIIPPPPPYCSCSVTEVVREFQIVKIWGNDLF